MVKIGLVLSGGGARGFAEIGALKVLKKNNIKVDIICGSSIGALIGACYAHNQNPAAIERLLKKIISKRDIYDFAFSWVGILKGQKIEEYLNRYFTDDPKNVVTFKDLKIPFILNTVDINNEKELVLHEGPLIEAIRASISYPGVFTTMKIGKHICVDGCLINPLPFSLLKNIDYIIMIDVSRQQIHITDKSNLKDILLQSTNIMQKTIVEKNLALCKIPYTIIRPEVEHHSVLKFNDLDYLTKKGELEAKKHIRKIKRDIARLEQVG
ncbi:MAG: patatin-like phospholipase family protein [Candidatus Woesearchaeota archaeon]